MSMVWKISIGLAVLVIGVATILFSVNIEAKRKAIIVKIAGYVLFALGICLVTVNMRALRTHKIVINDIEFVSHVDNLELKIAQHSSKEIDISINGQEFAIINGIVCYGDNLFPPEADLNHEVPAPDPIIANDPVNDGDFDPSSVQ